MRQIITDILYMTTYVCFGTTIRVARIIDGDTFETKAGDKVRHIGINVPEISDILGQVAKQYLSYLIDNKTVDPLSYNISNDRDCYQRYLRFVVLDGMDINMKMVLDSFAFAYFKYKFSKSIDYDQSPLKARESNKGICCFSIKETFIKEQEKKETSFLKNLSPKAYFVGSLDINILFIGLINY